MSKNNKNVPIQIPAETLKLARKRLEYKEDPIKFMEDNVKIPTPGGSQLLKLYEPQKKIIKSFFQHHELILLKSRQIGMSTLCQAIITYLFTFYENCIVGIVSRDSPEASDFCRKTQDMIDNLPEWLRPEYKNKSVQYFILSNGCQLHTASVSPANPGSVFRSKSITLLIIDEAAHIRNIDQAWTGIGSTLSKVQQVAAREKIPYGTIILSTPNKTEGIGKWYFSMWTGARTKQNAFWAHKIHWTEIPDFANDPNWYKKQCKILNNDKTKIAQELELKFVGTQSSLFDEEVQQRLQTCFKQPVEILTIPVPRSRGELHRFKEINRSHFHIIGVDCASPAGGDNSAIEVIQYETMEQVLEFCGKVDPKELTDIVKLISALCPHNIIVIENTGGYGQTVIYDLIYDEEVTFNLFGTYSGKEKGVFIPGLSTNAKTRPLILDSLYTYIVEDPDIIHSERLAMELLGLVNKANRVEADKGFHDDLALAYGFCCFVRKYCPDDLGDVSTLPETEAQKLFTSDSLNIMMGLNGEAPLAGYRKMAILDGKEDPNFKNDMDKYIRNKIESGEMYGYVDVLSMFGDMFGN